MGVTTIGLPSRPARETEATKATVSFVSSVTLVAWTRDGHGADTRSGDGTARTDRSGANRRFRQLCRRPQRFLGVLGMMKGTSRRYVT